LKSKRLLGLAAVCVYALFVAGSWVFGFRAGEQIGANFVLFTVAMLKILPCAFVLIGLFEVWVKPETVAKHLGPASGLRGYFWAMLLAGTTVGGLYVAFPVAASLYRKGAAFGVILAYVGAAGICRVPLTVFEASFLGLKFTAVRFAVSVPLVIISAALLGRYLSRSGYKMRETAEV